MDQLITFIFQKFLDSIMRIAYKRIGASLAKYKLQFQRRIPDKSVSLANTCFAFVGTGKLTDTNSRLIFPDIIFGGCDSTKKQKMLSTLTGLTETNLLFSRILEISFHSTEETNDFVKMGGFGSNTYKLKSLHNRLLDENKDNSADPFPIQVYSHNVKRPKSKLIILPECIPISEFKVPTDAKSVMVNIDSEYKQILADHTSKISISIGKIKDENIDDFETYAFYCSYVLKFALRQNKQRFFDILDKRTKEPILYECDEFVMVKDIVWDNINDFSQMHYIIIFRNRKLMSIRDLCSNDVAMLRRAVDAGKMTIRNLHGNTGIPTEVYFHYHPSIWQLHLHFVSSTVVEKHKKFMIDDIIDNIEKDRDHYKKNLIL